MVRLRSSSPFVLAEGVDFTDYDLRLRIQRAARRVVERGLARRSQRPTMMATCLFFSSLPPSRRAAL
jgi:hypothetical protein